MRLLANENVPASAVETLRRRGHDVRWVRTDQPGSSDEEVLTAVVREQRILLTFDKDFGELAFRRGLPANCGIILLRLSASSPEQMAWRIAAALSAESDWVGNFSVVEHDRVRTTSLPK